MPLVSERHFPRTLHAWMERFTQPQWHGCSVQGWLFEGPAARRAAERDLARAGVQATLRSAYKPLLHYFLEEVDITALHTVCIHWPQAALGPANRFLLEAWPLAALPLPEPPQFIPRTDSHHHYDVELHWNNGTRSRTCIFAPNRQHANVLGKPTLSPTGWLRAGTVQAGTDLLDTQATTDVEQAFAHALHTVCQHPWPEHEPYFERLLLRLDLPHLELPIPWLENTHSSLPEALHEDLYFSLLEWFQQRSGRAHGDRRLQPGQIVPDIRALDNSANTLHLHIDQQSFDAAHEDAQTAPAWHAATDHQPLDTLESPPPPECIRQHLGSFGGQAFTATTRQGRPVWGRYHSGKDAPVFLSAGQHANETSGIVGALRAAGQLLAAPETHLALLPLENPDGYALHHALCRQHPQHMHHAARYSALGDDIEYRATPPLYEREARQTALKISQAQLHINLHGYPAHEWTRPFSGYIPPGFADWMLPKGHFLIMCYRPGWQHAARTLLENICASLHHRVPELAAFNASQQHLYLAHAGQQPFEMLHGIACVQYEERGDTPVTLITEFPDETLQGAAYRFAHTVQMHTVLAAYTAWQRIFPTLHHGH